MRFCAAIALALLTAPLGMAQGRAEFFAGVSAQGSGGAPGMSAELSLPAADNIDLIWEFTSNFAADSGSFFGAEVFGSASMASVRFGPRARIRNRSDFTPFVHLLVGPTRVSVSGGIRSGGVTISASEAEWFLGFASGGGVDYAATQGFAIRIAQYDMAFVRIGGSFLRADRWSTGAVFRF